MTEPAMTMGPHDVNWGSHGCSLATVHVPGAECECRCCDCAYHPYPDWPDTRVTCVAKAPFYGPETRFYGKDAKAFGLPLVTD